MAQKDGVESLERSQEYPWDAESIDNNGQARNGTIDRGSSNTVSQIGTMIQHMAKHYAAQSYQNTVAAMKLLSDPLAQNITGGASLLSISTIIHTVRLELLHDSFQPEDTFWSG